MVDAPPTYAGFSGRFPEDTKIGRDVTNAELVIYHDNGQQVGAWRMNRRITVGHGEILSDEDAAAARHRFAGRKNEVRPQDDNSGLVHREWVRTGRKHGEQIERSRVSKWRRHSLTETAGCTKLRAKSFATPPASSSSTHRATAYGPKLPCPATPT